MYRGGPGGPGGGLGGPGGRFTLVESGKLLLLLGHEKTGPPKPQSGPQGTRTRY